MIKKEEPETLESLDTSVIESFKAFQSDDNDNLIADLIDLFIDDSGQRMKLLKKAVNEKDVGKIKEYAHTFKGSAGNIGAFKLAKLGKDVEENLDNFAQVEVLTRKMELEFETVVDILKRLPLENQ